MAAPSRKRQSEAASKTEPRAGTAAWDLAELRNIYRNAPVGFYSIDRDFRFVRANEFLAKLNGRSVADHIGRTVREVVPALADSLEPLYRQVLKSGAALLDVKMQWVSPTSPGEVSEKVSSYYAMEAEDGTIIGVSAAVWDVTQQERTERALQEREERYRFLFEKVNDGLFVFRISPEGVPGKFLEANEFACKMLGYSREELLEMSPVDLRQKNLPDANFFLRQALKNGQAVWETEAQSKSGAAVLVEISATAFELQGQPAILSAVRDIGARKRAEAELRKSIDLNEQILSSAQEGIVVTDRELRIVAWNPFTEALSGIKKQDALGRNPFELFPFLQGLGVDVIARRALAGKYLAGLDFPFHIPTTRKSGWVSVSTGPLQNSAGQIIGTLSTLTDITERRRMEVALRESDEFNRQVIENMGEGIAVCDADARTLLWNPFMEEVTGLKAADVLGKSQFDLFPFIKDQSLHTYFQRALQGETCSSPEYHYSVPQTQRSGWGVTHFSPLRNAKREIVGVLANVRETTESRQGEEELRRLSARLLQLQDDERRRIARDLHDSFAQRVLAVNLNLAFLEQSVGPLDERAKRALGETREIMGSFAKEIRSLSYVLHPPVLDELGLPSAIEEFAAGFSERSGIHVDVETAAPGERPPRDAEVALFRIVQEALANVQRHSGSPTAKIRLMRDDDHMVLEIADRGRWKPRRPSKEPKTEAERLGVGILGMRERMRQLGGVLEIDSSARGTTVRAVLPLKKEVDRVTADPDR